MISVEITSQRVIRVILFPIVAALLLFIPVFAADKSYHGTRRSRDAEPKKRSGIVIALLCINRLMLADGSGASHKPFLAEVKMQICYLENLQAPSLKTAPILSLPCLLPGLLVFPVYPLNMFFIH